MSCTRYRDALSDLAAGAAVSVVVEAHLASCAACRAELAALRQALAVADDEMAGLGLAEPSPDLVARIRRAVAESPEPAPAWHLGWGFGVAASLAAVIAATAIVAQRPQPNSPTVVADRGPAAETPRAATDPPAVAADVADGLRPVATRPLVSSRPRPQPPVEAEVLVPTEEPEALVRLAAELRRRSVPPDSFLVADLDAPLAEAQLAELRPLHIVPLDPAEEDGAE